MKTFNQILILLLFIGFQTACSKDDSDFPKPHYSKGNSQLDFTANFIATSSTTALSPEDDTFKFNLSGNSYQSSFGDFFASLCIRCNNLGGKISNCEGCFNCWDGDTIFFTIINGEIITPSEGSDLTPTLWLRGKAAIKEGTGKFTGATGTFNITASRSNPNPFSEKCEIYDFVCCGKYFFQDIQKP